MYQQGTGTAQDDGQAVRWYRAAAEQGYPPAQIALAKMYEQGRGVAQDHAAALVWYHRAAEHERSYAYRVSPPRVPAEAHARAGQMIESGHGVRADPAVAAWYYEVAAEAGNVDARFALAELYRKGKGVAAAPAAAERWYAAAAVGYARPAEAGDARAQDRLGQMYVDGRGVPKDVARGIALLERAAARAEARHGPGSRGCSSRAARACLPTPPGRSSTRRWPLAPERNRPSCGWRRQARLGGCSYEP